MDFERAKFKLKREYRERLISLGMAKRIMDFLEPLLPPGWSFYYDGLSLNISKYQLADAMEFRQVCNFVEKIVGKKLERKAYASDSLRAKITITPNNYRYLSIEVYLGRASCCKIEKKRKMRTIYIASPECLGNVNEKSHPSVEE